MAELFENYMVEGLPDTPANLEWLRAHFECECCGQCCLIHTIGVRINRAEAEALAQRDHLTTAEFVAGVLEDKDTFIIPQPCRYLVDNRCVVHDIKPSVCRKYPLHQRKTVSPDNTWVVITGCPGGQKILKLLTSGRQLGLEYRPIRPNEKGES